MNVTSNNRAHHKRSRLIGIAETAGYFGASKGLIYKWIANGLCTPGVKIGARAVRWPESELHRIAEARVAGASENQLRALVTALITARTMAD